VGRAGGQRVGGQGRAGGLVEESLVQLVSRAQQPSRRAAAVGKAVEGIGRHNQRVALRAAHPLLLAVGQAHEIHLAIDDVEDLGVGVAVQRHARAGVERQLVDGEGVARVGGFGLPGEARAGDIEVLALARADFAHALVGRNLQCSIAHEKW
nr:hypothetical protein [Tanacetum cinerariifolium]